MRKSMTYGTLPSSEEFEKAFWEKCPAGKFSFGNDLRVGTCELNRSELWGEIEDAHYDWESALHEADREKAGDWCSLVLGILGFEWI